jgi:hypothetical protein
MLQLDLVRAEIGRIDAKLRGYSADYDRISLVEQPTSRTLHALGVIRAEQDRLLDQRLDLMLTRDTGAPFWDR